MTSDSEVLADAVRELNKAILALRTLIEREYPNRREIEAEFVRKKDSNNHLKIILILVLVTTLLSFGATVGTMSSCFISNHRPDACHIIPGFDELEKRRLRNDNFDDRLDQLEERVEELRKTVGQKSEPQ